LDIECPSKAYALKDFVPGLELLGDDGNVRRWSLIGIP
jgi:hypothetical protein